MARVRREIDIASSELPAAAAEDSDSQNALGRLADEQAALRRVATLVARNAPAAEVFDAVAAEMARLLGADAVMLSQYDEGEAMTVLAHAGMAVSMPPVGTRFPMAGQNTASKVWRTQRAARTEDYTHYVGPLADLAREQGIRSTVGAPIIVVGQVWAVVTLHWRREERPSADTEERMSQFAELLGMAIANAEGRSELAASRRRIVAASDEARRRIERDLHDGVQQQLVTLSLALRQRAADAHADDALSSELARVSDEVDSILDSLVEIARGIHPAILTQGGLAAALRNLAHRCTVPVELDERIDAQLPDDVQVAAYYFLSEALTNVAKHARATAVHVYVTTDDGTLKLTVRDDGVGGAALGRGSGLVGLEDRVEALGGKIAVSSPAGYGTSVVMKLPIVTDPGHEILNVDLKNDPTSRTSPT
jgi:signal transduction histidine kinase